MAAIASATSATPNASAYEVVSSVRADAVGSGRTPVSSTANATAHGASRLAASIACDTAGVLTCQR